MLKRSFFVSLIILLVLLSGNTFPSPTGNITTQNKVYKYKVLDAYQLQGDNGLEAGLNKLGAEGWELVSVESGIPNPDSVMARARDIQKPIYYVRPSIYYFKHQ